MGLQDKRQRSKLRDKKEKAKQGIEKDSAKDKRKLTAKKIKDESKYKQSSFKLTLSFIILRKAKKKKGQEGNRFSKELRINFFCLRNTSEHRDQITKFRRGS